MEDNHHKAAKGNLKQVLVRLQKGLESALSVGYKTALETARAKNYLAFILFCQGHHQEALDKTEEALSEEGEGQNLVALANRATILWRMEDRQEAEEEIRRLQILRNTTDFNYLKVKARAELAFCYSRLDPEFYTKAVRIFEEVLVEAQEPEKWLWTFGLGLTKRRLLSGQYAPMFGRERNLREDTFEALDVLLVVINKAESKNLRAKAHAEVAVLISYMTWDKQLKRDLAEKAGMGSREACNVALKLDDSDNSVLCKTAKIFKKMRETQRSVDLLERALSIRESSTAYHHLGQAYKDLASDKKREDLGSTSDRTPQYKLQPLQSTPDRTPQYKLEPLQSTPDRTPQYKLEPLQSTPDRTPQYKLEPLQSTPDRTPQYKLEPLQSTLDRTPQYKLEPLQSTPDRTPQYKLEPLQSTPDRTTQYKLEPLQSTPDRTPQYKLEPLQSTPDRTPQYKLKPLQSTPDRTPQYKLEPLQSTPDRTPQYKLEPLQSTPDRTPQYKLEPLQSTPDRTPQYKLEPLQSTPDRTPQYKLEPLQSTPDRTPQCKLEPEQRRLERVQNEQDATANQPSKQSVHFSSSLLAFIRNAPTSTHNCWTRCPIQLT
nr:hypothetical protein BaRGS_031603 [Batillaria attramentaria]